MAQAKPTLLRKLAHESVQPSGSERVTRTHRFQNLDLQRRYDGQDPAAVAPRILPGVLDDDVLDVGQEITDFLWRRRTPQRAGLVKTDEHHLSGTSELEQDLGGPPAGQPEGGPIVDVE